MYYFDTYAIIEIIKQNPNYKQLQNETILTSVVNLAELYYSMIKEDNQQKADDWMKKLRANIIEIDIDIIKEAMLFKYKYIKLKMSMVDCIGYAIAKKYTLIFVTGDKAFENMENVLFLKQKSQSPQAIGYTPTNEIKATGHGAVSYIKE
jgi:predicted nucleic acid-binding protein